MATQRVTPPWNYLHEASAPSLESFELSRLNHAAHLRKEIGALLEQWIEELAEAMLARWVREDREKLSSSAQPDADQPVAAQPLDIGAQAELPLFSPRTIDLHAPQANRRLRSRRASPVS